MSRTNAVRRAKSAPIEVATLDRSELEHTLGFNLRRAWVHMEQVFAAHMAKAGVTPQLYAMLLIIDQNPHCTISGLCRAIGVSQTNIVPALDGLMARGLVFRDFSAHDRRVKLLSLTEIGKAYVEELRGAHQSVTDHFESKLGPKNMKVLVKLLAAIGEEPK